MNVLSCGCYCTLLPKSQEQENHPVKKEREREQIGSDIVKLETNEQN